MSLSTRVHMSLCDARSLWMLLFFSSFFLSLCVLFFVFFNALLLSLHMMRSPWLRKLPNSASGCLLILMRKSGSLLCGCVYVCLSSSSSSLNHGSSEMAEKNMFHGP